MTDYFLLDFPVLQPSSGDFIDNVKYEVGAKDVASNGSIEVSHFLSGSSFIAEFLAKKEAVFSAQFLYRDHGVREEHNCFSTGSTIREGIGASVEVPKRFSYAPEIVPSIVLLIDAEICTDVSSGLSEFWRNEKALEIPAYSRIARHEKLTFTSGDIFSLMQVYLDNTLSPGTMKTEVNVYAGEGEIPVALYCAKDVYDELELVSDPEPKGSRDAMAYAIITQALCSVYGYMHEQRNVSINDEESSNISRVLQAHLESLNSKTGMDWNDDEFNSGLAATRMSPYAIDKFQNN